MQITAVKIIFVIKKDITTMYENIMCLPYFQGMSKDEITSILDKVKLEFTHYNDGEQITAQGSLCNKLTLLIRGNITSTCTSPDKNYTLIEELTTPFAFEPYSMFGASPYYRCSYQAKGDCDILKINKSYLFDEFSKHEIFLMNLLNLISQRAQQKNNQIWSQRQLCLSDRIIEFISIRTESQSGYKILQIKMEVLAAILGETRINVSRILNTFQQKGIIELRRKEIHIPDFKKFIKEKNNP